MLILNILIICHINNYLHFTLHVTTTNLEYITNIRDQLIDTKIILSMSRLSPLPSGPSDLSSSAPYFCILLLPLCYISFYSPVVTYFPQKNYPYS